MISDSPPPCTNSDLNTNGTVVAFGDVHTDGSVWAWWTAAAQLGVADHASHPEFHAAVQRGAFWLAVRGHLHGARRGRPRPRWSATVGGSCRLITPVNIAGFDQCAAVAGFGRPPVALTAQASPGQLTISWPSAVLGAALCYTTNLSPAVWQPVTNPVVIATNGALMVIIPQGHDNRFFQLRGP